VKIRVVTGDLRSSIEGAIAIQELPGFLQKWFLLIKAINFLQSDKAFVISLKKQHKNQRMHSKIFRENLDCWFEQLFPEFF
jgi:hypothetical protein